MDCLLYTSKIIEGGVCAAKGFKAGSVRCGVKESRLNDDTAIIFLSLIHI